MSQTLQRAFSSETPQKSDAPTQLEKTCRTLERTFDKKQVFTPPAEELGRQALERFYQHASMTRKEMRRLFGCVALNYAGHGALLFDRDNYPRVQKHIAHLITTRTIRRREWQALSYSFFSLSPVDRMLGASDSQSLGELLYLGIEKLAKGQWMNLAWVRLLRENRQIYRDEVPEPIVRSFMRGQADDAKALFDVACIPPNSWFWDSFVCSCQDLIEKMDEVFFIERLPFFLSLHEYNEKYRDDWLCACLTRYSQSSQKSCPSQLLRAQAMQQWGSPRLSLGRKRWEENVDPSVVRMVLNWIVREDLEDFFSLLRRDSVTDKARLYYWLSLADQIEYTRIYLGLDALTNNSSEFSEFRKKNSGRYGRLDMSTDTNAVIMKIGGYYFVEFSITGNACYVYSEHQLPFDINQTSWRGLKNQNYAVCRLIHVGAPACVHGDYAGGWFVDFDTQLAHLGIFRKKEASRTDRTPLPRPVVPTAQSRFALSSSDAPQAAEPYKAPTQPAPKKFTKTVHLQDRTVSKRQNLRVKPSERRSGSTSEALSELDEAYLRMKRISRDYKSY